jgi:hypothetical protein
MEHLIFKKIENNILKSKQNLKKILVVENGVLYQCAKSQIEYLIFGVKKKFEKI